MIHLQYEINTNVKMNTNNIGKSLKFLGYERVKHPSEKICGSFRNYRVIGHRRPQRYTPI